jgi:hypothetical protein
MLLRRRKYTFGFVFGFFILGLLTRTLWDSTSFSTFKQPPTGVSRAPSAIPPPAPRDSPYNYCQNIYPLVCQKNPVPSDPTGGVRSDVEGEKFALRLYADIIHEHRDWSIDEIDEEMAKQTFTPVRRARIESAFRWAKHVIEKLISSQPFSVFTVREKQHILSRLRETHLEIPPPASLYADEPDLLTKNEIYYERTDDGKMRLRVGGAYLFVAKSWFNIVFTLAHELAHSIDPCEMRNEHFTIAAYNQLTSCFLQNGLIAISKDRMECGANDQLSETFADWMAVQVTAEALKLYSTEFHGNQIIDAARNSVRDLCEQDNEDFPLSTEFHPTPSIRISKIFGNHPVIQSLLGCENNPDILNYCSLKSLTSNHPTFNGEGPLIYEK